METVPHVDTFLNQEVGTTDIQLDIRRAADGAAVEMRCNLRIVRFTHRRDFLRLKDAARDCQIHLQNGGSLLLQQIHELILREQPFAGGNRDAGSLRHARHFLDVFRGHRLLKPEWFIGFNAFSKTDGTVRVELPVRSDENIAPIADSITDGTNDAFGVVQRLQSIHSARIHRVEFHSGKPFLYVSEREFRCFFGRITAPPF